MLFVYESHFVLHTFPHAIAGSVLPCFQLQDVLRHAKSRILTYNNMNQVIKPTSKEEVVESRRIRCE